MTWWFGALAHSLEQPLCKARSFETEHERRLIEAYARGRTKHRER